MTAGSTGAPPDTPGGSRLAALSAVADGRPEPILVVASDEGRAGLLIAGVGPAAVHVALIGQARPDVRRLTAGRVGLVVVATPEPDMPLLKGLLAVPAFRTVPIVVFVDRATHEQTVQAIHLGVAAFIVDGLEPERVPSVLDVAVERHAMTSAMQAQLRKYQEDLAARKSIERAKGLIMSKSGLSEQEAYDSMRRIAMTQGKPLRDVAETILSVCALFP